MLGLFLCLAPFIHDGDNIRCNGRTMRLAAIDAPDFLTSPRCRRAIRGAWCDDSAATSAREHLRALVTAPVRCRIIDANPFNQRFDATDRYGRPVVRCMVNGVDLSEAQLRGGFARQWPNNVGRYKPG